MRVDRGVERREKEGSPPLPIKIVFAPLILCHCTSLLSPWKHWLQEQQQRKNSDQETAAINRAVLEFIVVPYKTHAKYGG